MKVNDIAKLGKLLAQFLAGFASCFTRPGGRALLRVYVQGLLSDVQRKHAESIALDQNVAPRIASCNRRRPTVTWDLNLPYEILIIVEIEENACRVLPRIVLDQTTRQFSRQATRLGRIHLRR